MLDDDRIEIQANSLEEAIAKLKASVAMTEAYRADRRLPPFKLKFRLRLSEEDARILREILSDHPALQKVIEWEE